MTEQTTDSVLLENYLHHIDVVNEEHISGWAFKQGEESHHPVIEVRTGDLVLWSSSADMYREDLVEAGIGNGEYGFILVPVNDSISEAVTSVAIYIDGFLAKADIPLFIEPPVVEVASYRAHLDHFANDVVRGWVFKEGHENYRAKVEVRCGDSVIASGLAENYREDLLDADIGDGCYGFSITPRLENFPMSECDCQLFVDGEAVSHIESFMLSADQDAINEAVYKVAFSEEIADFTQSVEAVKTELKQDLIAANRSLMQDDHAVNGQLQVAMDSIAELSVRVKVIEQILVKHFSEK